MKLRRIVIAAVAAAALIVAAAVVVSFLPTKSGHSVAQSVLGGAAPPAGSRGNVEPSAAATRGARAPHAPAQPTTPSSEDNSLMGAERPGGATATPYALPRPTQPPKSVTAADIAVTAPRSKVASKSISKGKDATHIVVDATTSATAADTLAYYQGVFTSLGMTGKRVPAVGGSSGIAFRRSGATVTLTITARKKGSSYLIHGVLRTGA